MERYLPLILMTLKLFLSFQVTSAIGDNVSTLHTTKKKMDKSGEAYKSLMGKG